MVSSDQQLTKQFCAIGMMSGTSMDGVDAAIIYTDGINIDHFGPSITLPYTSATRALLKEALSDAALAADKSKVTDRIRLAENAITECHGEAVEKLLLTASLGHSDIDVIGFHGHTVTHKPMQGWTWQIGDAAKLARRLGIPVVGDFRSADMAANGQGAPLIPVFHAALLQKEGLQGCYAILNIGGVANVSWICLEKQSAPDMLAFDTGPGGAMLDDWAFKHLGEPYDKDGKLAKRGSTDLACLRQLMLSPYFSALPPKTLDRDDFSMASIENMSPADGASTLTDFVVEAIVAAQQHFPRSVDGWYVCGGGRHNTTLMQRLGARLPIQVISVDKLGWRGDMVEAEGFGYFAVRHLKRLPITIPQTTGCRAPTVGGVLHRP